jgi:hypothetical protein
MNIPHGQATGCNPRTTKYGECCAKFEDSFDIITDEELLRTALDRPIEETLLSCVEDVFSQGRVTSCASEAVCGAWQVASVFSGAPFVKLSPWSVFSASEVSGGRNQGSTLDDNLQRMQVDGALTMKTWPRSIPWNRKPPKDLITTEAKLRRVDEYYDINSIAEIKTALFKNFPVLFGGNGHAEVLLALRDSLDTAYKLNSWGAKWSETGLPGIGKARLDSRDIQLKYGCWALRTVTIAGAA